MCQTDFLKKNSPIIKKTDKKKLFGPGQNELQVKGAVHATLTTKKMASDQDLHVVTNLKESLVGRPAITTLHLLERVNSIHQQDAQKEYLEVFSGLGGMKNEYKISLDKNVKHFSIAMPVEYLFH